jgi:hypothetical protein
VQTHYNSAENEYGTLEEEWWCKVPAESRKYSDEWLDEILGQFCGAVELVSSARCRYLEEKRAELVF